MTTLSTLESLEHRIAILERQRYNIPSVYDDDFLIDNSMRRARTSVEQQHHCYSVIWKYVPKTYYTWTLQQRANCLQSFTIHSLCKTLLMENRKASVLSTDITTDTIAKDPTNPQFVLILLQYATSLDVKKLNTAIRRLRTNVNERLNDNQFDWRIAGYDDNQRITGYEHGSVTLFGLLQPKDVMIIISSEISKDPYIYMGGGHTQCKLGIAYKELIQALPSSTIITDISQPRSNLAGIE